MQDAYLPGLIPAQGNPDTGASYVYVDSDVVKGATYFYKLEDVDLRSAFAEEFVNIEGRGGIAAWSPTRAATMCGNWGR